MECQIGFEMDHRSVHKFMAKVDTIKRIRDWEKGAYIPISHAPGAAHRINCQKTVGGSGP
jgi:hypothetical protein